MTRITNIIYVKCVTSLSGNGVHPANAKLFTHVLVEEKCTDATDVCIEVSHAA